MEELKQKLQDRWQDFRFQEEIKEENENIKQQKALKLRGYRTVAAGFILMFYNGSTFMVGNIAPYIQSYFQNCLLHEAQTLLSYIIIFVMIANFLGSNLVAAQVIHPRSQILIGGLIGIIGVRWSTIPGTFDMFEAIFTISYGFGTGFVYTTVLYHAWLYFPGREGTISGLVITGFGMGGFISTSLSTKFVNPDGVDPIERDPQHIELKPFGRDVASNLPEMFTKITNLWAIIIIIAILLVQKGPSVQEYFDIMSHKNKQTLPVINPEEEEVTESTELSVEQLLIDQQVKIDNAPLSVLLSTKQFRYIFSMNILSIFLGVFVVSSSKSYAIQTIKNEAFLSEVASLGTLFGAFRIVWSVALDKFSYKVIYGLLLTIQAMIGFCFPLLMAMEPSSFKNLMYGVCVCTIFNCEGGHFVLTPTVYVKLYGVKAGIRVQSVGDCFIAIASIINISIFHFFFDQLGFGGISTLYGFFNLIALVILTCFFKEERITLK